MEILSTRPVACLHCGEPALVGASFCCRGCESVFTLLQARGMGHFYQLRDQFTFGKPKVVAAATDQDQGSAPRARFYVEGIHCLGCLWLLEKLPEIDHRILSSQLDLAHNILQVEIDPRTVTWQEVRSLIAQLGYTARAFAEGEAAATRRQDLRRQVLRLGVAAFSAGNVMLLAVALYAGATTEWTASFRWLSAALAAPALTYSAWPLYRSAFFPLLRGRISTDLAIVLALLAGVGLSLRGLIQQTGEIYFDSLSMLVFLLLSSRYLLNRYRESLAQQAPFLSFFSSDRFTRLNPDAGAIAAQALAPGDTILLLSGQTLPVDGTLLSAEAHFDCSLLTGESLPVKAVERESVDAGARLVSESARFVVQRSAERSRLGCLLEQIHSFRSARSPSVDFAERVGKYFVVVVLGLAAATLTFMPDEEGIRRALALVIVTCPCVLAFAVPLAFSRAMQRAAGLGILFSDPAKIENLSTTDKVFLDKTGTLTSGQYEVKRWVNLLGPEEENLHAVAGLEQGSSHPVARALQRYCGGKNSSPVSEKREIPGLGVSGQIDGSHWELKRSARDPSPGENEVELFCDDALRARITLGDSLRAEAPNVIEGLKARGMKLMLLSGDSEPTVAQTARRLGIPHWRSRLLPEQKAAAVKASPLSIMVGDGANDAVAFQAASVGIAVQGAMEVSLRNADIALTKQGISGLLPAIDLARSTMSLVRLNFGITLAYNIAAGALALSGYMSPLLAAILMPSSALSVFLFTQWRTSGGPK